MCFQSTSVHPELQALIPGLLAKTWSTAANITFTGFGACATSGNQVTVVFAPATSGTCSATVKCPLSYSCLNGTCDTYRGSTSTLGAGTPTVTLVSDDPSTTLSHFSYEVVHEFGHALGFAHEMQRPDNWDGGAAYQCGVAPTSTDYGNYAPQPGGLDLTPNYDPNSIMNYCGPDNSSLSVGDVLAVSSAAAYGPSSCLFTGGGTVCTSAGSSQLETYTIPGGCPATTSGWILKSVSGGTATPVLNTCLDGSLPGTCAPATRSSTSFALGWQSQGVVASGPAVGTAQTVEVCDAFNNCSAAFQLTIESCNDLYLDPNDSPLQVVQGGTGQANVLMLGPWVASDLGNGATGKVLSTDLTGATMAFSTGTTIDSLGAIALTVVAPATARPGPYEATVQVTDAASKALRTAAIPIEVLACVPTPTSSVCLPGWNMCGPHSAGCGVSVDCGSCASGSACSNGTCCPNGKFYNGSGCQPDSCAAGTSYCPLSGTCLTETACEKLNPVQHCKGTTCM